MFCTSKRIQVLLDLGEPPSPEDVDKFEEIPSRKKRLQKQITYAERLNESTFCYQLHQCSPVKLNDKD